MTSPSEPTQELEKLLTALVDGGELSPLQQQHLSALLRDNPALQQQYRDYLLLDALLHWETPEGAASPTASPVSSPRRPLRWHPTLSVLGRVAACFLLVALGYLLHALTQPHPEGPPVVPPHGEAPAPPEAVGLAVLTHSVGANWEADGPSPGVGATVGAGRLKLKSGLVQLEFFSGATLVVEGPADLDLLTVDRLRCRAGKLRATVPSLSQTFTILSSSATLSDFGTEFGVEVSANGATEVHVFAGKLGLQTIATTLPDDPKHRLAAGQGVKVEEGGRHTAVPFNADRFRSSGEMNRLAEVAAAERQRQWLRTGEQLRRDPRVLAYFPFQNQRPGERTLVAENAPDGTLSGAIIGCDWVGGRWPGKQALEFKRPGDRVRLTVPGEYDALTFMAWVRVDALEHRFNGLFLSDGFEAGSPHWQITDLGRLRLGVCHGADGDRWLGNNYDTPTIFGMEQLGRWKHLATTCNAEHVAHYVNGQLVALLPLKETVRLIPGDAELGNWRPRGSEVTSVRSFNGRMDEFCLFGQALTAQEVEAFYRAGEPVR